MLFYFVKYYRNLKNIRKAKSEKGCYMAQNANSNVKVMEDKANERAYVISTFFIKIGLLSFPNCFRSSKFCRFLAPT